MSTKKLNKVINLNNNYSDNFSATDEKYQASFDMILSDSLSWHRHVSKSLVMSLLLSMLTNGILGCVIISLYLTRTEPAYFAQTPDLRLTKLVPLNEPYITDQGLLDWTVETTNKSLGIDFLKYKEILMEVRSDFTDNGFKTYVSSLKDAGIIDFIKQKNLLMHAAIEAPPLIKNKGQDENGIMSWVIEYPALISYESSQGAVSKSHYVIFVKIVRVSTLVNPRGIQIDQLVIKTPSTN